MAIFSFIPDLFKEGYKTVTHVINSLDELKNAVVNTLPKIFDETLEIELSNKGTDFDFHFGVNTHDVKATDKDGNKVLIGKLIAPHAEIHPIPTISKPEGYPPPSSVSIGLGSIDQWTKIKK